MSRRRIPDSERASEAKARAPISAADALYALRELRPDADATAQIIELLQIERVAAQRPQAPVGVHSPRVTADVRVETAATPKLPVSITSERKAAAIVRGSGRPTMATLESTGLTEGPPEWLASTAPFSDAITVTPTVGLPIFAAGRARSIVAASVSTRSNDGPIAMRALIEKLCRLEPVSALPRRAVPTVRRGVQLLVDRSSAMDPYSADIADVVRVVSQVVGTPRTQLLRFSRTPLTVTPSRAPAAESWRAPALGTPVFIISDLGIGGDALGEARPPRRDWLELARRARSAGCAVVALVPFAPDRWDPQVARVIMHIHWDHRMTAGAVRRAIGPGHVSG